jgi:dolichyl-diphosphooligosaccharide--protein glycosyltransferase
MNVLGNAKFDSPRFSIVFWVFLILSYAAPFVLRYIDFSKWDKDIYRVDGEQIMGTHDAYAWLAGAKGLGPYVDAPLSNLVALLSGVFGSSLGNTGFWLPVFVGPLVGVAVFLLVKRLFRTEAAICAGMIAANGPGFYYRNRFGYLDTDIATLFFPLIICLVFVTWLTPRLRPISDLWERPAEAPNEASDEAQDEAQDEDEGNGRSSVLMLLLPLFGGIFASYTADWHGDIRNYGVVALLMAVALCFLLGKKQEKPLLFVGLGMYALSAFYGSMGIIVSFLVLTAFIALPHVLRPVLRPWPLLAVLAIILVLSAPVRGVFETAWSKYESYAKGKVEQVEAGAAEKTAGKGFKPPSYPGITQSVIEAQNIPFAMVLEMQLGKAWFAVIGLAAFLYVVYLRPTAILLLPLVLISLLGSQLGSRMTMFGGPAVAVGLGVGMYFLSEYVFKGQSWKRTGIIVVQVLTGLAVLVTQAQIYEEMGPTPIIRKYHCMALKELAEVADENAAIWTWWDWGYAAMYYAERHSFADGGNHDGKYLYPLARAMATDSHLESAQIMKFSAVNDYEPWEVWNTMPDVEVQKFVSDLRRTQRDFQPKDTQYIVISWENIPLSYWIGFYGSWDVVKGDGVHGKNARIRQDFNIDFQNGKLNMADGQVLSLAEFDGLKHGKTASNNIVYDKFSTRKPRLVFNGPLNEAWLMDKRTHQGMAVQLLVSPHTKPEIAENFRLVVEGFPFIRIYEVL